MTNFFEDLASRSEVWAIVALIVLAVLEAQGWVAAGMFDKFWPILIGYAGLRVTSKVSKNAVSAIKEKRSRMFNAPPEYRAEGDK